MSINASNRNEHLCTGAEPADDISRRGLLSRFGHGMGAMALSGLLGGAGLTAKQASAKGVEAAFTAPRKAKRVIFLFQAGAPSQMDLHDYKPRLNKDHGQELPAAVRMGQRLTGMSGNQSSLPLVGSPFKFAQHGDSGAWVSELLPHTAKIVDDLCVIKTVYTEAINHGPAVTMMQTGSQFPGRPSMGAWYWYGLGDVSENLPAFVVLVSNDRTGQPLVSRYWGSGFLPGKYDGVLFRPDADAVLYLNSPPGIRRGARRQAIDRIQELNQIRLEQTSDPELETRIAQYEMAFRMQASVPEVTDLSGETEETLALYGEDVNTPGSYAANCIRARRLVERGVRFVQLYHPGWDHHAGLPSGIRAKCRQTDQATAALVTDLKRRGMLDDTLVIWGGEFGRTSYCQGKLEGTSFGRDHHPRCFTMWMAGGGSQPGLTYGETDDYSYNVVEDPVHIHDLHATILHMLGIDHELLTFRYQGRQFRLTDVHGKVVEPLLA